MSDGKEVVSVKLTLDQVSLIRETLFQVRHLMTKNPLPEDRDTPIRLREIEDVLYRVKQIY